MASLSKTRNMLEAEEEVDDTGRPASGDKSWIPELSPGPNIVVRRCSRILGNPVSDLQKEFDSSASQSVKDPSQYARNLLEFCCFRALALSTHATGHLGDAKFRRLTFDMMLAWEAPSATSQPLLSGRLVLTDHALYFEPLRVVSYDKAKRYDLDEDLKQVVKPEMTGPWGTRLFYKAVLYKSISVSEPVVMEFPERKGNTRRDYWLVIIQEILFGHRFIRTFQLTGNARDEALLKAVLEILRLQAIQDMSSAGPIRYDSLLVYTLCDNLPGGDLILETLASMLSSRQSERAIVLELEVACILYR